MSCREASGRERSAVLMQRERRLERSHLEVSKCGNMAATRRSRNRSQFLGVKKEVGSKDNM